MSTTTTHRREMPKTYAELVRLMPPRTIHDDVDLENVTETIDRLAVLNRPTKRPSRLLGDVNDFGRCLRRRPSPGRYFQDRSSGNIEVSIAGARAKRFRPRPYPRPAAARLGNSPRRSPTQQDAHREARRALRRFAGRFFALKDATFCNESAPMKAQPDFTKLFREFFGEIPKKATYRLRNGPNRVHDLVFLSSIIHDARFRQKDLILRGTRLTIPIERDCWELLRSNELNGLHVARSRLFVSPVDAIHWSFCHDAAIAPDDCLWIDHVWLDDRSKNPYDRLIISGSGWDCAITANECDLAVRLEDTETPYLHPQKHKSRVSSS